MSLCRLGQLSRFGDRSLEYAAEWDVVSFGYSQSGRYRVVAINADARTELRVIDSFWVEA